MYCPKETPIPTPAEAGQAFTHGGRYPNFSHLGEIIKGVFNNDKK